jgi:hypothetical protein
MRRASFAIPSGAAPTSRCRAAGSDYARGQREEDEGGNKLVESRDACDQAEQRSEYDGRSRELRHDGEAYELPPAAVLLDRVAQAGAAEHAAAHARRSHRS